MEGEIPSSNLLIDDRPHLPPPGVNGILPPLLADLVRKTQSDGPFPFRWNAKARTNVIANPVDALSVVLGSKKVEAGLKAIRKAMGDFDGFVKLVVGGIDAVLESLRAFERE